MGKLSFSGLVVTPLGPDNAMVLGRWKVEKKKETSEGLFTLLGAVLAAPRGRIAWATAIRSSS